ncbi:MAG: rhomboid family intramembrane serine protease [Acidobacteria bacterium]|nr:rhomboid family intramembrane serine protease [Acidobacteriota bacterium]
MSLDFQNDETREARTAAPVVPFYTIILIGCLIMVAIAQIFVDGNGPVAFGDRSAMIAGFVKPAFLHGDFWRILTGAALHGGLIHLAFNCYAFYVFGRLIETLSNRAHLAIVFLLSAVGGGILSLIFLPGGISVGASGGIVGLLGYLAVYGFKRRALLSSSFLKNMLFNIGFIAIYGVFLRANIDNFGHLGGLLTGAVYGFFQIPGNIYEDPRAAGKSTETIGLIALGAFIAVCAFAILVLLKVV